MATASCDGGAPTESEPVATVTVTPDLDTLTAIGATRQLVAALFSASGNLVSGTLSWRSTDVAVASVSAGGLVQARAAGSATIVASVGTAQGTARIVVQQRPAGVRLTPPSATLRAVGATMQLHAAVLDAGGAEITGLAPVLGTPDTSVVRLAGTGVVTARKQGTATITARFEGFSATASVGVTQVLKSVRTQPDSLTLPVGSDTPVLAYGLDSLGAVIPGAAPTWASRNPSVASLSSGNRLRGEAPGTTWATATLDAFRDSTFVRVVQEVASVEVTPDPLELTALGDVGSFSATGRDGVGNPIPGLAVTWSVAPGGIVAEEAPGTYRAAHPGTATVTATTGGISGTATVVVAQTPASLAVTPDSLRFTYLGESRALSRTVRDRNGYVIDEPSVQYTTSDVGVASVNSAGVVTAAGNGTAQVRATSGTATDFTVVTVAQAPATVEATGGGPVRVGATRTVGATVKDAGGAEIAGAVLDWSSSNPGIATVDGSGAVTGVAVGQVWITAALGPLRDSVSMSVVAAGSDVEWVGDLTIKTQADLDAVRDGGYNKVTGTLFVGPNATVTSLAGLEFIEEVAGNVLISENPGLLDASLPALTSAGHIGVSRVGIRTLSLPSLRTAAGLHMDGAPDLATIDVSSLTHLGYFMMRQFVAATTVSFPSLTTVAGNIELGDTSELLSIQLPVLTSVGLFSARQNRKLTTVDIPALTVTGDLDIRSNPQLTTVSANFRGGTVEIIDNPNLTSISLPSFAGGSVTLTRLAALSSLSAPELTSAPVVDFLDLPSLSSLSFPKLATVTDLIHVEQTGLGDLSAFSAVTSGVGQVLVVLNPVLTDVSGLHGLGDALAADPIITGSLTVASNDTLPNALAQALFDFLEAKFGGSAVVGTVVVTGNGG